ncbi:MAG TPA: ChbG/HpnK family deacetylase [Alphaproteobacteria bacterium]|jgi:predicted glycoside hydrolase/deacetylase ChbG (UPF0249 family)
MSRPFILCADDFGLTQGVDAAILDLAGKSRLSAVSGMVTAPAWRADAARLRGLGKGVELGLHLTLTEFAPLTGASSLAPGGKARTQGGLLAAIVAKRLRRDDVRREIARQIEAFADGVGRRPDYVDGHHHAHQFPLVDALVVEAIAAGAPRWRPWLRVCAEPLANIRRRGQGVADAFSAAYLGRRLGRKAQALAIPTNAGISGFYDVRKAAAYAALFPSFLIAMGPRHLIVCHPGHCAGPVERARPWMACREHEYAFLASSGFAELCARNGVRIATFAAIAAAHT